MDKYKAESEAVVNDIKYSYVGEPLVVGVGLRLTDYVKLDDFYHQLYNTSYYDDAFRYLCKDHNCTFLIFSDDIELAKTIVTSKGWDRDYDFQYDNSKDDTHSFALMSYCDGVIMANSTFHWWSAWLNNKIMIAPKLWYKKQPEWDATDIYTDKMIVL